MLPAISAVNLCKTYREGMFFPRQQQALKGLSLEVQQGEIFGLLGGNGAGKTTFIKILLGIIRKSTGQASLLGFAAGDRQGRRLVGYLPENLRVPRHLTAWTALEYYGHLSDLPGSVIRQRRGPLLELVGLAGREKDSVRTYSKGMLQRLGLAQAMLHDPQLLIFDEPTDGLDPLARSQVRGIMLDLKRQGKTIFLNSHILQEVELVCDRVAILNKGELRRIGRVEELTSTPRTSSALPDGLAGTMAVPAQGLALHLELLGSEAAIRQVLAGHTLAHFHSPEPGRFDVTLHLTAQVEVDILTDRLRQAQISLAGLRRRKVSLEDVYIEIIGQANQI